MVSHGLPGGLVGSGAYLYRFTLRVFGFRVLLAGLCASQWGSGRCFFFVFRERMCFTRYFQVRGLWLFRVAPCGFSMLIFVCVLVTDLFVWLSGVLIDRLPLFP